MYRPQFAYPSRSGCVLKNFAYEFDGNNVPLLGSITLASGESTLGGIPLPLDSDHPFLWRAAIVSLIGFATPDSVVGVQFKEPFGHLLSSAPVLNINYLATSNGIGLLVPMEPEFFCPAGQVITVYFQNFDPNPQTFSVQIDLVGFKVYEPEACQK